MWYSIGSEKYSGYWIIWHDENEIFYEDAKGQRGKKTPTADLFLRARDAVFAADSQLTPEDAAIQNEQREPFDPKIHGHRVNTDLVAFHKPIEMMSIAMEDENEIRVFKEKCPDVEVDLNPESEMYGIPIARNRKGKLQALAAAGFIETN